MELPKTSKLPDGFVGLEIGDVTTKGRSCTFTLIYDFTMYGLFLQKLFHKGDKLMH